MKKLQLLVIMILFSCFGLFGKTDGTSGIPLGGIGTGAIKYNASTGKFTANFRTPVRDGNFTSLGETQFQIYTQRGAAIQTSNLLKAVRNNGRVDDDAIFPLHRVNFGEINNVSVNMTAYMPYDPQSIPMMCHPSVMFEFTCKNLESSDVSVAIDFQLNTSVTPLSIIDTGFSASDASFEYSLMGDFPDGTGIVTFGNDNGFYTTGLCNNVLSGLTNRLSLKINLLANESRKVRFVLSWYQPDEKEHYQYTNLWDNAKDVSVSALNNFDTFKDNAEELVSRMRASNLPEWLEDQVLNTTANLVNNSVYFQDGRYCHTEGQWEPEGTMDQMWHARQIYTMINPELAWMELEWWARTQHVTNYTGQIHHDFGIDYTYVGWDDIEHSDYRDIHEWVDLNCGFIISVYETFIATADSNKLAYFWLYTKKAAQRILNQVQQFGSSAYPYTFENSLSTYDAGGNSQAYNTGLSIVAYKIMISLAEIMGETDIVTLYNDAFTVAKTNFEARWLDNAFSLGNYCESILGGPWIANYFKMEPFWEKQKTDNLYITIQNYYEPLSQGLGLPGGSYSEWAPYLVSHLGGYALQTNRTSVWESLQKDMYERNYFDRNRVFNQELGIPSKVTSPVWIATSADAYDQYISIPVLWRNYYNITGYHYNKYTGELWLEPSLIDTLNNDLDSAVVITPDGYVTISYNAYGDENQNQEIVFQPDQDMEVSAVYVWDKYKDTLNAIDLVQVNTSDITYIRTGKGDLTQLKLDWKGTITSSGITIRVEGKPKAKIIETIPDAPENIYGQAVSPSQLSLSWNKASGNILGYVLELKKGTTFEKIAIVNPNDTIYSENGLLESTEYTYRVRCYNSRGISESGQEVNISTLPAKNGEVVYALNAGGSTYTSAVTGIEYVSDATTGWVTGGSPYSKSASIEGTEDDAIYITERYGNSSYSIPLENDTFNLVLKFAEIYHSDPGSRVFHVDVEGERLLENFDIVFRSAKNTAYDVVIPVIITDGTLNIEFVTVTDNAKVSAMEIRKKLVVGINDFGINTNENDYFLSQNYPNPAGSKTTIAYNLKKPGDVSLTFFDINGKKIRTLVNSKKSAGSYQVSIENLNSGIYYYQLQVGDYCQIRKMVVVN